MKNKFLLTICFFLFFSCNNDKSSLNEANQDEINDKISSLAECLDIEFSTSMTYLEKLHYLDSVIEIKYTNLVPKSSVYFNDKNYKGDTIYAQIYFCKEYSNNSISYKFQDTEGDTTFTTHNIKIGIKPSYTGEDYIDMFVNLENNDFRQYEVITFINIK